MPLINYINPKFINTSWFKGWFLLAGSIEVIGVIHLPRLPRTTTPSTIDPGEIIENAVREASILCSLGYDGVIVENYGDAPFEKRVSDPLTLSFMSVVVREVVKSVNCRVGVNLLRNSGLEAYSIAVATGAHFIRVNALVETIISDSGLIEPEAPRLRDIRLNHPGVKVYADILVKHATSLRTVLGFIESTLPGASKGSIEDYLRDLIEEYVYRGGADALITTGLKTGEPPPIELVKLVKKHSPIPVLVGSGVTLENIDQVVKHADGVIVGSTIKKNGRAGNPLDVERARVLIERIREKTRI